MNDICRLLDSMKEGKDKIFAMATIIRVHGSAYRREGARMLIGEDGSYSGTISAGCLEADLIIQSQDVIKSMQAKTVNYDLRSVDDLSWGQGAGCDGNIEVYIEPIGWGLNNVHSDTLLWPLVDDCLSKGMTLVSVKSINNAETEHQLIIDFEGKLVKGEIEYQLEQTIIPYIEQFIESGTKVKLFHITELGSDYLFEIYQPKNLLFVFGAGPDAEPIVNLAAKMDYSVTVIDPRSSRCNEKYFKHADMLILEHPDTFFSNRQIGDNSYVLVMTHNFNWDQIILENLMNNPPKYLGVLGPKRRTERLLGMNNLPDFIHSPIGLNIHAEGPDEISISVLAELINFRNQDNLLQKQAKFECFI